MSQKDVDNLYSEFNVDKKSSIPCGRYPPGTQYLNWFNKDCCKSKKEKNITLGKVECQ